jgi:ribonuclease P protein component
VGGGVRHQLGRRDRLRRRSEYVAVQDHGLRLSGRHYLLLARRREAADDVARLGVTVSRKVGSAVQRNLVKRWVRECFRRTKGDAPRAFDLVVVARPSAASSGLVATCQEIASFLRRLGSPR